MFASPTAPRLAVLCATLVLSACVGLPPPIPRVPAPERVTLVSVGDGLARAGQWRSQVAVADLNGDGRLDLLLPAPRKGGARPVFLVQTADGKWTRWNEAVHTRGGFDYGGAAALDIDQDGTVDALFGMHLKGLAALRQSPPGTWIDASSGLNLTADGKRTDAGSQSVLALPTRPGADTQALVAYETQQHRGLGVSLWRYDRAAAHWIRTPIQDSQPGSQLQFDASGRPVYLSQNGIQRILLDAAGPRSRWVGHLQPKSAPHAFAPSSVGNAAYIATSTLVGEKWSRRVERYAALAEGEAAPTLPSRTIVEQTGWTKWVALAAVDGAPWGWQGELLAVGDDAGEIALYSVDVEGRSKRMFTLEAPAWRARCDVAVLKWAPLVAGQPPRLIALFAGDASVYDLGGGCKNGGGMDVFALDGPAPR